jgi:signal transduction histidine kinase
LIRQALHRDGNELADRPEIVDELITQACAVYDDVMAAVVVGHPVAPPNTGKSAADCYGAGQAQRAIDWGQLLRGGTTLFEVMLPIVLRELAPANETETNRISALLHQAVLSRVLRGPLARMTFLTDQILTSRRDERRRIARELHDRVLHGIGLAHQDLDLHRYHAETSPALARAKLDRAIDLLRDAIHTVQRVSAELRRSFGDGGLVRALRSYLEAHAEPSVNVMIRTKGDLAALPADAGEELYLIVREAARNALRHASPSCLDVSVEVTDRAVYATVADDGRGFAADVTEPGGGLSSMRERALLMCGELSLSSTPDAGTRVEVRIPLRRSGR